MSNSEMVLLAGAKTAMELCGDMKMDLFVAWSLVIHPKIDFLNVVKTPDDRLRLGVGVVMTHLDAESEEYDRLVKSLHYLVDLNIALREGTPHPKAPEDGYPLLAWFVEVLEQEEKEQDGSR